MAALYVFVCLYIGIYVWFSTFITSLSLTVKVEHNLLSPYVSVSDVPFRHILSGSGEHTIRALLDHLNALKRNAPESSAKFNQSSFLNQFAFATWTIQSCANDLAGPVWEIDNEI